MPISYNLAATWNVHQIAVIAFRKEYDEDIVNVWLQVLRRQFYRSIQIFYITLPFYPAYTTVF